MTASVIVFWRRRALSAVVRIDPPPPTRQPNPIFHSLVTGSRLLRIFNPEPHGQTATGFRRVGPIERFDHHEKDKACGILYAAYTLSCCLVECFGDTGVIDLQGRRLGFLQIKRTLLLLDLRRKGAMRAGSVAAFSSCADRNLSQKWSRHFHTTYPRIDGLIYSSAHNEEAAIAFYERVEQTMNCTADLPLKHRNLRSRILFTAQDHGMIVLPGSMN
ncbi:MAG: RES domain-containing protein [Cyanobium sp.]